MIKLIPLILSVLMAGEAGWTIQITNETQPDPEPEVVEEVHYYEAPVETEYVEPETEAYEDGYLEYLGAHQVTGYTWTGNTMANGVYPSYGWCACNGLPLGSQVYIEGLGYFTVGDRGGMTDPYWIDIYFDTVSECYAVTGVYDIYLVR